MTCVDTYESLDEWAETAIKHRYDVQVSNSFAGDNGWNDAIDMIKNGWEMGLREAMPISETALKTVETETELPSFNAEWLMSGSEVDVGRYLQGIPECMIEYEPTTISKVGRVITLCASVSASGSISAESMLRRGAAVVGLAMALEQCGHAMEIYAEMHATGRNDSDGTTRVLVKGAHDQIDPARIAYALGHPGMLRRFAFACMHELPPKIRTALGTGITYGTPTNPRQDLPDGTIYLPCVRSNHDIPDADRFIIETLREIGLVE